MYLVSLFAIHDGVVHTQNKRTYVDSCVVSILSSIFLENVRR